ncbi:MAG: M48 family metalloprotease [Deltaproteobacteria bacterium]|jgi:Zn-dependent protease with chaperone function|nr:M48 family metalloprotease [Deltaproteobacteria bacterium]
MSFRDFDISVFLKLLKLASKVVDRIDDFHPVRKNLDKILEKLKNQKKYRTRTSSADLFEWQTKIKKQSDVLIHLFFAVMFAWVILFYGCLILTADFFHVIGVKYFNDTWFAREFKRRDFLSVNVYLVFSLGVVGTMIAWSTYHVKKIRKGGTTFMASVIKAVPLNPERGGSFEGAKDLSLANNDNSPPGTNRREFWETDEFLARAVILGNVVEEVAVAAVIPTPDVYVIPRAYGINAMAAGPFDDDGAIFVTLGALKRLSRDELSGLVAHETSHLANGDGLFFSTLAGILTGLALFFNLGTKAMRFGKVVGLVGGAVLIATGLIAWLIGKFIQISYSKRREYLADAKAVELLRSKECLASVLKKIGGFPHGSVIQNPNVASLSHFFIGNPKPSNVFSAHPPLEDRIFALDPDWDGKYFDFEANPVNYLEVTLPLTHQPKAAPLTNMLPVLMTLPAAVTGLPAPTPGRVPAKSVPLTPAVRSKTPRLPDVRDMELPAVSLVRASKNPPLMPDSPKNETTPPKKKPALNPRLTRA